jgi:hypothetical protein
MGRDESDGGGSVMPSGELYEKGTAQPTPRLRELQEGAEPTMGEVLLLWAEYREGEMGWGNQQPTLEEFGQWLSGTGNYEGFPKMEVHW